VYAHVLSGADEGAAALLAGLLDADSSAINDG
jgi:hypothetical protein